MNEYTPTWGLPVPVFTRQELLEELEIAQKDGAKFRNSVYAGTLVRAIADCKRCMGGCRLWLTTPSRPWMPAPISVETARPFNFHRSRA